MSVKAQALAALYAKLPGIKCKGICQHFCGPIDGSAFEVERLEAMAGRPLRVDASLTCSMLGADGRCAAYAVRPMVCRLFGVADGMLCPHGCVPERVLTRSEGFRFLLAAERIGGRNRMAELPTRGQT